MLWPLVRGAQAVEVGDGRVRLKYGMLGGFDVPALSVQRLSRMSWPWWGGLGVRIGRRMVTYVGRSGQVALLELDAPVRLRVPVPWNTARIAVAVEDVEGFLAAVARERIASGMDAPTAAP